MSHVVRKVSDVTHQAWGANLRRARLAAGLSQQLLADLVDVRAATISRWESGKSGIRDHHKIAVANALGRKPSSLFPLGGSA